MNKNKILDVGVTLLGIIATILSGMVAERKMKEAVKEEVKNQLHPNEED